MEIRVVNQSITELAADAIIVNLFEGVTEPGGATGAVDAAIGGLIAQVIARKEFTGKLNECVVLHTKGARKVVVVGLGKPEKWNMERVRQAAGSAVRAAMKGNVKTIATIVHGAGIGGLDARDCAQAVVEGAVMGLYSYQGLKSHQEPEQVEELIVADSDASKIEAIKQGVARGRAIGEAVNWARCMVNAPANYMTPTIMADMAVKMAKETGLSCQVLERADMERMGMGIFLGVAQGSTQPPKMISFKYEGNPGGTWIALVGKGITFDSGGISLKPGDGMEFMKDDMAGAAAVISAMKAIAAVKPHINIIGIAALTENMPAGNALKPGDVIKGMTGKTIEIISTDAEGRLILADAVAYAESLGATVIVDVATLTGAAAIALGSVQSGIVANCDNLVASIKAAGAKAGERYWQMPSDEEYKEQYKSDVADLKNGGGREGGVITGGLIIGEFVEKARWAHLDIAITSWNKAVVPYIAKGATGVAVRTLVELASELAARPL